MAAFGASVVASDRVAGAELLQRDIAKRRHEAREAMEASRRDVEAPDGSDEGDIDGEDIDGDGDVSDGEEERALRLTRKRSASLSLTRKRSSSLSLTRKRSSSLSLTTRRRSSLTRTDASSTP